MCWGVSPMTRKKNCLKDRLVFGQDCGTLLSAAQNAWHEVHELLHSGLFFGRGLAQGQEWYPPFLIREVWEKIISQQSKGVGCECLHSGKGKGKTKSKSFGLAIEMGVQEPKGCSLLSWLLHQRSMSGPMWSVPQLSSRELSKMGLQGRAQGALTTELFSQGSKGSDGCRWRCGWSKGPV